MLFSPIRQTIEFDHGADHLVGDLYLPQTADAARPVPAVVLVAGSGPGSRSWEDVGERFTAAGLAVYSYDKPGVGESSGDWTRQTISDRAAETRGAVAALMAVPGVDEGKVALFGGSQGGWVAPLAAAGSDEIAAVCFFSGPGVTVAENEEWQIEHRGRAEGYSEDEIAAALALFQRLVQRLRAGDDAHDTIASESAALGEPWSRIVEIASVEELNFFAGIADYTPVPALEALRCPLLAVYGSADVYVPVQASIAALEAAFARSGHTEHEIVVFEGADHGIRTLDPQTGQPRRAPGFFELVVTWLCRVLR